MCLLYTSFMKTNSEHHGKQHEPTAELNNGTT